ncbi:hypothetical protein ACE4RV_02890 [Acetobacter persici]|uniref:hypothetical protein n=1 Tax=Acetobacter persici TaxID=1076596 RepID=UPI0036D9FF37
MGKPDFRRLNTRIAYPWPVDVEMPQDIDGVSIDETIYGASQIAEPSENMDEENE